MQDSEQKRPQIRRLGDRLGAWYTPFAVTVAGAAWVLSGESHRFLSVLAIATPCPLLIGIPVAVLGAISMSAGRGILVRNPAIFEMLGSCGTFIFDKTGTLTAGKPSLTSVICAPGFEESEVLQAAAALERYSRHPLADAVVQAARRAASIPCPSPW
jgi:Cation transport ATPase